MDCQRTRKDSSCVVFDLSSVADCSIDFQFLSEWELNLVLDVYALLDVVVSGDANGVFCCWCYSSGLCLRSKKHDFLLGTISGNFACAVSL